MFLNPDSFLFPVSPERAFSLFNNGAVWQSTYLAKEAEFRALGITFAPWRDVVPVLSWSECERRWGVFWDAWEKTAPPDSARPGTYLETFGSGVIPVGESWQVCQNNFNPLLNVSAESSFRAFLDTEYQFDEEEEQVTFAYTFILHSLGAWLANGMFQLEICLTACNCFGLDHRGAPKKA